MSFIRKIIGPDEKFIGLARIHWIYAAKGFVWLFGLMGTAYFIDRKIPYLIGNYRFLDVIGDYIFWAGTALGAVLSFFYFIMWIATEIGLTDKRIIFKRGLIFIDTKEVDLEEIKAAEVDNGILGSIFNYGYVYFDARFIENVSLPAIADPYRFVKALNEARSGLKQDSMKVILEGKGAAEKKVEIAQPAPEGTQAPQAPVEAQTPPEPPAHKLEEARYDAGMTDALSLQTSKRKVQKPNVIIFPRNIEDQKEMLRRRVKNAFTRRTQKEKA